MCWLTGNTKSVKNGFISVNAAIQWVNKVKDVIMIAVTAVIKKMIMITPPCSRRCAPQKNASCKTYRKRSPPSARESTD